MSLYIFILHHYSHLYSPGFHWIPVNSDNISHACHSQSWKEAYERLGRPEHLLMISFFLDEWRPYTQRPKLVTGIYMYITNSKDVS